MKPVFLAVLVAACLFGGCDRFEDKSEPAATPTSAARFTPDQAAAVIKQHEYSGTSGTYHARCDVDEIRFERGFWICGNWTLDEMTGTVFRTPQP